MEPLDVDLEAWRQRMGVSTVGEDMAALGFRSPEDLAASFVAADEALGRLIGDGPTVTDNRPRIEYFNLYPVDPMGYDHITRYQEPIEKYLVAPPIYAARLRTAKTVQNDIWREHESEAAGRLDDARTFTRDGLRNDPENAYLRYLRTRL
jgi:spermidine synthase